MLLGTPFTTAPIDFRERVVVVARMFNGGAREIPLERMGVLESSVIETCNRIEFYLVTSRLTPMPGGIYGWAENIREEETNLAPRRLSQLSDGDRRTVEAMSGRLASKLKAPHAAFAKQQGGGLSQKDGLRLLEPVFGTEDSD